MRIIEIKEGGDLTIYFGSPDLPFVLKQGHKYVLNDVNATSIASSNSLIRNIEISNFDRFYKQYHGENLDGKTLVAYRTGGAGDILFMTPALKLLKKLYPTCKLVVCTSIAYKDIITDNEFIDEFQIIPTDIEVFEKADYHILFERIIEENLLAEYRNAYDLYLHRMGLFGQFENYYEKNPDEDCRLPVVGINPAKLEYVKDILTEYNVTDKDIKIGFNPWSTTLLRNYSLKNAIGLVNILAKKGVKVFLIGGKKEADASDFVRNAVEEQYRNNVINFANHSDEFGYTVALVSLMDVIVGIDSSVLHIAGGLKIPLIGLFGPFASVLRIGSYKKAIGLEVKSFRCAPCFIHGPYPCRYANESGMSPCLELIQPHVIIEQLQFILQDRIKFDSEEMKEKGE